MFRQKNLSLNWLVFIKENQAACYAEVLPQAKLAALLILIGLAGYDVYKYFSDDDKQTLTDAGLKVNKEGVFDNDGKLITSAGSGGVIKDSQSVTGAPMPDPDDEQNAFKKAYNKLSDKGKDNVDALRQWAKDNGFKKLENNGGPEVWGVEEADGTFSWRLKIKPEPSNRPGLLNGSNAPRFDARLDNKGTYTNPLTKEVGGKNIGTHIPLE